MGWTDANEDGEFCVALRCALLDRRRWPAATPASAWCATPIPTAELAETEVKLQALLPVLAG